MTSQSNAKKSSTLKNKKIPKINQHLSDRYMKRLVTERDNEQNPENSKWGKYTKVKQILTKEELLSHHFII